jgi:hypothetical protein
MHMHWIKSPAIWLTTAVVAVLACGFSASESSSAPAGKYEQTWTKSYSDTTCIEWSSQMDAQQRFAAAADMLTGARNKGDGGAGLPSDDLIRQFEADVSEGCSANAGTVADTGASIYMIGRETYRP